MASCLQTIVFIICWFCVTKFGSAQDSISTTQFLRDPKTLKSSNGTFMLGFFSPINSLHRYIGIWYNYYDNGDTSNKEVVWVANRESPLNDSSGVLKISEDGNLQLLDGRSRSIWSTNITTSNEANSTVATLDDMGNFVLSSKASGRIIWQSFAHSTDTLLPHMKASFEINSTYTRLFGSWKSASDPSYGRFHGGLSIRGTRICEIFFWDGDFAYWRSGPWSGSSFLGIRNMYYSARDNGYHQGDDNAISFSSASNRVTVHNVLTYNGSAYQRDWNDTTGKWTVTWQAIEDECDTYGTCGEFGICNAILLPICSCLRGFVPRNHQEWSVGIWRSGCVRRTDLQCGTIGGKENGFLKYENMKVPDYAQWLDTDDEADCRKHCLGNCSCLAYAYYLNFGCMLWYRSLIDIKVFPLVGVDLFIRLPDSELGDSTPVVHSESGHSSKWKIIIAVTVTLGAATLAVLLFCLRTCMRQQNVRKTAISKGAELDNYLIGVSGSEAEFQELPLFTFEDLQVATNNFSESNKIGQGGFGPVYKGKFGDGQEIAVKRLSRASRQGPQEFMNEVVVISKLQHRNLVSLLGCCVEGEERLLVYEYMPNKSLDALLFDPSNQKHLDWEKRFNIMKGISRRLLYLHRDSRLKIIHRDIKASNILLDASLNPKISDFGMARIFGGNQDHSDTTTIVGTYGYMSPEYALEGRFSGKSDVFSFGVILLELLSGKSNNSFKGEEKLSLLGQAWILWNEGKTVSFVDPRISKSACEAEIMMCMQLGLMCVQEYPEDRPTISMVVAVLESEVTDLPRPAQPAYMQKRNISWNAAIQNGHEDHSHYVASIDSYLSGR